MKIIVVAYETGPGQRAYLCRYEDRWLPMAVYSDMRLFDSWETAELWAAEYVLKHPKYVGRLYVETRGS